ncbi:MAG: DUF3293 domain-containing protein [Flavobacteriaceae bacterium]|nr:DUF3293 domain-containing protein [Flavobacteriaceae bacterium]
MNSELYQAFLNTTYRVLQSPFIDININQANAELSNLQNWAFITAWNPLPAILPLEENQVRNQQLQMNIEQLGLKYSLGVGISEDEKWSEESFFIENINLDKANEIACKYGQLAFVFGGSGQYAMLYYTKF